MGKHVEVVYFETGASKDLLDVADNRYLLDRNFFNSVWVIQRRPQHRRPNRKMKGNPGGPNHNPGFNPDYQS
jgi:hypothetical protein